jgi:hypothetical protein
MVSITVDRIDTTRTYGKGEGELYCSGVLMRMSHISINIGKHGVAAPWRHEQTE